MQSAATHLRARIMEGCPAIGGVPQITNRYKMITALLNHSVRIDGFALDELQNSLELASFASLQELNL